jgi:hypothetical protein
MGDTLWHRGRGGVRRRRPRSYPHFPRSGGLAEWPVLEQVKRSGPAPASAPDQGLAGIFKEVAMMVVAGQPGHLDERVDEAADASSAAALNDQEVVAWPVWDFLFDRRGDPRPPTLSTPLRTPSPPEAGGKLDYDRAAVCTAAQHAVGSSSGRRTDPRMATRGMGLERCAEHSDGKGARWTSVSPT